MGKAILPWLKNYKKAIESNKLVTVRPHPIYPTDSITIKGIKLGFTYNEEQRCLEGTVEGISAHRYMELEWLQIVSDIIYAIETSISEVNRDYVENGFNREMFSKREDDINKGYMLLSRYWREISD